VKDYFLDTSFLIELSKEKQTAINKHKEIKGNQVTGTPCIYELSKFTQFNYQELFGSKEVLQLKPQDAATAGKIYYQLKKQGELIGEIDLLIAGITKNRELTLVTKDEDFQKINNLNIETF